MTVCRIKNKVKDRKNNPLRIKQIQALKGRTEQERAHGKVQERANGVEQKERANGIDQERTNGKEYEENQWNITGESQWDRAAASK